MTLTRYWARRAAVLLLMAAVTSMHAAVAQERMPPIPPEQMTEAQKTVVSEVVSGPRGRLSPPFVPILRSPELLARLQKVGEYLIYHNSLEPRLFELSVLMLARQWTQQFEWRHHYPLALKAGLRQDTLDAIAEGRRPPHLSEDESLVFDFVTELLGNKSVSEPTYARFAARFGAQNLVDLIGTMGFYTSIAMVANVDRTPLEDGTAPLLLPLTGLVAGPSPAPLAGASLGPAPRQWPGPPP
jgi:4-carboxymuconolactone decarboxylase